jgi:hypothetical protein
VAIKTVFREDRPDVASEGDLLASGKRREAGDNGKKEQPCFHADLIALFT